MRLVTLACTLWLVPSAFAQSPASGGAAAKLPVLPPGVHDQTLERADGPAIKYAISIPPESSSGAKVPLILSLHFGGDPAGAGRTMLQILVQPALWDVGAIILAPDSLEGGWNTAQNEHAVQTLLDAALRSYNIDPRKILVTGFSMGGSGTWHWANKFPDRFSAAIPMAGRPTGAASTWRVPVFAVHSQDDERVPIGPAKKQIDELKQLGKNAQMVVVHGIAHYETRRYVDALRQAIPWLKELWQ
jgi:predicted peptidase